MAKDLRFNVALHTVKAAAQVQNETVQDILDEGFVARGIEVERTEVLGRQEFDAGTLGSAARTDAAE